jgi:hypothetical protein
LFYTAPDDIADDIRFQESMRGWFQYQGVSPVVVMRDLSAGKEFSHQPEVLRISMNEQMHIFISPKSPAAPADVVMHESAGPLDVALSAVRKATSLSANSDASGWVGQAMQSLEDAGYVTGRHRLVSLEYALRCLRKVSTLIDDGTTMGFVNTAITVVNQVAPPVGRAIALAETAAPGVADPDYGQYMTALAALRDFQNKPNIHSLMIADSNFRRLTQGLYVTRWEEPLAPVLRILEGLLADPLVEVQQILQKSELLTVAVPPDIESLVTDAMSTLSEAIQGVDPEENLSKVKYLLTEILENARSIGRQDIIQIISDATKPLSGLSPVAQPEKAAPSEEHPFRDAARRALVRDGGIWWHRTFHIGDYASQGSPFRDTPRLVASVSSEGGDSMTVAFWDNDDSRSAHNRPRFEAELPSDVSQPKIQIGRASCRERV